MTTTYIQCAQIAFFPWKFFTLRALRSDILTKIIIVLHQFHYAEYVNEVQTLNTPPKKKEEIAASKLK